MNIVLILAETIMSQYEQQTASGGIVIFQYDEKYRTCVARFPIHEWEANDFELARLVLCQPLPIAILVSFETGEEVSKDGGIPSLSLSQALTHANNENEELQRIIADRDEIIAVYRKKLDLLNAGSGTGHLMPDDIDDIAETADSIGHLMSDDTDYTPETAKKPKNKGGRPRKEAIEK